MKRTIISLFAAGVLASVASAQLYVITGTLNGTGVKAEFNFSIDDVANTVTVDINNNILGTGGAKGAITEFGFNVPDSLNLALVSFTATGTGGFLESAWTKVVPYSLTPGFDQDFGVNGSPTPNTITWGNTAQFVFTFPDFGAADVANFIGQNGLSVRFQSIVDSQAVDGTGAAITSEKAFGGPGDDGGGGGGAGAVPEPSTYGLFGAMALLGLMVARRARRS